MGRLPRKIKKKIPKDSFYCYTPTSKMIYPENGLSYYSIKVCPFYKYGEYIFGYCNLIKCEVIDQVKECGERCP